MQKQDLAKALKLVAPALHSRDFIPVLTHVCFNADSLFAFDDKTAVIVFEETGIQCAARGRVLIEMVENAEDDLELSQDGNELVLSDGSTVLRLPVLSPETFLFEMPDTDGTLASISGDLDAISNLMDCLDLAAANSNEESLRPELVGVTMVFEDEHASLFSTDNISCTKVVVTGLDIGGEGVAIIPKSSCALLAKTFRDLKSDGLEGCSLFLLDGVLLATYDMEEGKPTVWVACKTVPSKPADYEAILSQNLDDSELSDVPEGLEKALSRASAMFKDDYSRAVAVVPTDEGFTIECKGDFGELESSITSECLPTAPVNINPDLVRRMLSTCQGMMFCKNALAMYSEADQHEVTYLVAYKRA